MDPKQNFICKTCGAPLNELAAQSDNGLVKCPFCSNVWTIPRSETIAAVQFLTIAEHDLDTCKFDDAFEAYKKAAELDPKEPEAFFGMALSEFKVQYLKDEASEPPRLQPICHEISEAAFSENKNYKTALGLATEAQKAEYVRRAAEIEKIGSEFFKLKQSGLDYDCFICVKVTDENKNLTQDSHEALRLYHYLKDRGYSPFYSEEEIVNRSGADYEALILYALYSSECMLIVCSNEEYLRTKWVKNEYTRFTKMMARDGKESDALTFVFRGKPIERLPGQDQKIQGIDLARPDAYSIIEEYISSFRPIRLGGPGEIKRKEYTGAGYKKKNTMRQGVKKRELSAMTGGEITVSDKAKLQIVKDSMARKNFSNAIRFADNLIEENPANGDAYFLRFLSKHSCVADNAFASYTGDIDYEDLEKAIACAKTDERKDELYSVIYDHVKKNKDLASYKEYIELPDSSEQNISELTDIMYRKALAQNNREIFDEIIKTVNDAEKYIAMNLEFVHKLDTEDHSTSDIKYYRNILKADEGHGEALWRVFASEHGNDDDEIFEYFCDNDGAALESALFAYGYNEFANDKLFEICLVKLSGETRNIESTCKLFDFVLTMIPKDADEEFKRYLDAFIDKLFACSEIGHISKYNEMLLGIDKLNDKAYVNRVLVTNKFNNPLMLMDIADKLYDDKDYLLAINSYAEANPDKSNFYFDVQAAVADLAELIKSDECREYLYSENKDCTLSDILSIKEKALKQLDEQAQKYLNQCLYDNNCDKVADLYSLMTDVTGDENLNKAFIFAKDAQNDKLAEELGAVLKDQAARSRDNYENEQLRIENEKREKEIQEQKEKETREAKERALNKAKSKSKRHYVITLIPVILSLLLITTIILGLAKVPGFFEFYFALYRANAAATYTVSIMFIIIPLLFILVYHGDALRSDKESAKKGEYKTYVPWVSILIVIGLTVLIVSLGSVNLVKAKSQTSDIYIGDGYMMKVSDSDSVTGLKIDRFCRRKKDIVLPESVNGKTITVIGKRAFKGVKAKTIALPDKLVRIEEKAFKNCKARVIAIPASVSYIGYNAFRIKKYDNSDGKYTMIFYRPNDWHGFKDGKFVDGDFLDPLYAANCLHDQYCDYEWSSD